MDHYKYKVLDVFWDIKMVNLAKRIKKNKYYKFIKKHYKKIIGFVAMMSYALVLKDQLNHFYAFK